MDKVEMRMFRDRLLSLRDRLSSQLGMVEEAIPQHITDPGGISSLPTHPADQDAEGVEKEIVVAKAEVGTIREIDDAIQRIDDGTFGQCQQCGRPIAPERLAAIPYTPYCVECARQLESSEEVGEESTRTEFT